MKWISIKKANVKFNTNYLVTNGEHVDVVQLDESKVTACGIAHTFLDSANEPLPYDITHLAIVTLPEKGE